MNSAVFSQNSLISTCLTSHQIETRELPSYLFGVVRNSYTFAQKVVFLMTYAKKELNIWKNLTRCWTE